MSMWLNLCRVNKDAFAAIRSSPELLDDLFFEDLTPALLALGIVDADITGVDFMSVFIAHETMAELEGEEVSDDVLADEFGDIQTLGYDAGYDPAFYLEPDHVPGAMEMTMTTEMDEEVEAFFTAAVAQKQYVIGLVS